MRVSFKPVGDGFEDEGLFCHGQAERTYLINLVDSSVDELIGLGKALLMWARR